MPYEIQTYTLTDVWTNTWSCEDVDGLARPETFGTAQEAEEALAEHLDHLHAAYWVGQIDDYDRNDFRIRPEDMPKGKAKRKGIAGESVNDAAADQPAGLSSALVESLTAHRSAALAASLLDAPDTALAAVVYTMALDIFWKQDTAISLSGKAITASGGRIEGLPAHRRGRQELEPAYSRYAGRDLAMVPRSGAGCPSRPPERPRRPHAQRRAAEKPPSGLPEAGSCRPDCRRAATRHGGVVHAQRRQLLRTCEQGAGSRGPAGGTDTAASACMAETQEARTSRPRHTRTRRIRLAAKTAAPAVIAVWPISSCGVCCLSPASARACRRRTNATSDRRHRRASEGRAVTPAPNTCRFGGQAPASRPLICHRWWFLHPKRLPRIAGYLLCEYASD